MVLACDLPASYALNVGMKKNQYTIRQVPANLDEALRRKAKQKGQSLNQVLLDSLAQSVGEEASRYHDLDELAGSWKTDKAFDDALKAFDTIDPNDWK
jgi:hypothetical protein